MPTALALMWQMVKDPELTEADRYATLLDFDRVLGLRIKEKVDGFAVSIDPRLQTLLREREDARAARDFKKADAIRAELASLGYDIIDTAAGPLLKKLK